MTGTPGAVIVKLNTLGYELYLEGDKVKYRFTLSGNPPANMVKPLLDKVREHKEEVLTYLKFKDEFKKLAKHLKQRDYTPENFQKLQKLFFEMDTAWESMDYSIFKKVINRMMEIQGNYLDC